MTKKKTDFSRAALLAAVMALVPIKAAAVNVSGTASYTGGYPAGYYLTVWVSTSANFAQPVYFFQQPTPSAAQAFTIAGVPGADTYFMALTGSISNNWALAASTDPWGVHGQLGTPTAIVVAGSDITGINVTLTDGNIQPNPFSMQQPQASPGVYCAQSFANGGSCKIDNTSTYSTALAVDSSSNSFVIGTNLTNSALIKFDADGVIAASVTVRNSVFNDVKINPVNGDLYIAAQGPSSGIHIFRYTSALSSVAAISVAGYQGARQLDFDAAGNVYAVSTIDNGGGTGYDIRVVKLPPSLSSVTEDWSYASAGSDKGYGITINGGDLYLTGVVHPGSVDQVILLQLNTANIAAGQSDSAFTGSVPVVFNEGEGFNNFRAAAAPSHVFVAHNHSVAGSTATVLYRFNRADLQLAYSSAVMAGADNFADLKAAGSEIFVAAQSDFNQARVTRYDAASFTAEASTRASVPGPNGMGPASLAVADGGQVYLSGVVPMGGGVFSAGVAKIDSLGGGGALGGGPSFALSTAVYSAGGGLGNAPNLGSVVSSGAVISYKNTNTDYLRLSRWNGSGWADEAVKSGAGLPQAMFFDADQRPGIIYYDGGHLAMTKYDGAAWNDSVVSSAAAKDLGSLGIDADVDENDYPIVAYYNSTDRDLEFTRWNGASWTAPVKVDETGDVGREPSIINDFSGGMHISYFDATNSALKYAYSGDLGLNWAVQTVDTGNVGLENSISVGTDDQPQIAYQDAANNTLKYAREFAPSTWSKQTLDATGAAGTGMEPAIDVDPSNNHARIAYKYYDSSNYGVKFASCTGAGWVYSMVETFGAGADVNGIDLMLNASGDAQIAYAKGANDIRFATSGSTLTVKPYVLGSSPAGGETGVAAEISYIDMTFSEAITLGGGDVGTKVRFFAGAVEESGRLSAFTLQSGTTYRLTLQGGPLAAGTVYRVELTGFANAAAAVMNDASFSFTTAGGGTALSVLAQDAAPVYMRYYNSSPVLKLSLWTDSGSAQWTALAVGVGGTAAPADLDLVNLYRDNGDGVFSMADSYLAGAIPASAQVSINLGVSETIGVSTGTYFVTASPRSSAVGKFVRLILSSTSSFSLSGAGSVSAVQALPLQSAQSKVLNYINATEAGSYNYDTNISATAGQALQINATGYWNYDGTHVVDADGSGACSASCPIPSAPRGALIARGDSTPWFVIGRSTTIVLGYSDTLRLAMNDDDYYNGNSGVMMFDKTTQASTKFWTGAACGGIGCNEASMPTNWLGGVMPAYGDNVVFSTAAKGCLWNLNITLNSFTVGSQFTNGISMSAPANRLQMDGPLTLYGGSFNTGMYTLAASSVTVAGGSLNLGTGGGILQLGDGGLAVYGSGALVFSGSGDATVEKLGSGSYPISITGGTVTVNGGGRLRVNGSRGITVAGSPALTMNNVGIEALEAGSAALSVTASAGARTFTGWSFDSSVSTNVTGAGLTGSATVYMNNASGPKMGTPNENADGGNRVIWNPDGGGTGSFSGAISYSGSEPGAYLVFITTDLYNGAFVAKSSFASGNYSFTGLNAPATYYVWAVKDSDDNFDFSPGVMEPIGWRADPAYLAPGGGVTMDFTMMDTGKVTGGIDKNATTQAGRTIIELHVPPISGTSLMTTQSIGQWEYTYGLAAASGTYTVLAFVDANQNGLLDAAFESSGTLAGVHISSGVVTAGQDVTLSAGAAEPGGVVRITTAAFFSGGFIGRYSSVAALKLGLLPYGGAAEAGSLRFSGSGSGAAYKFGAAVYKDDGNGVFDNDPEALNPPNSDLWLGNAYFDAVSSQAVISFNNSVSLPDNGATQYFFVTLSADNPALGSTIGLVLQSSASVGLLQGSMDGAQPVYPASSQPRAVRDSLDAYGTLYTGLDVYSGQTINISASGQWRVNGVYVVATGTGSNIFNGIVPSAPVGALIARVGYNSPWFFVGTSTGFVYSGPSGQLMLHMNANYNFSSMIWNYPNDTAGRLYVGYSVIGDTHAVLSGTVTYNGGASGTNIILNTLSPRPNHSLGGCEAMYNLPDYCYQDVITATHTIPLNHLSGGASFYTMTGIETAGWDVEHITLSAYIENDPSQRGLTTDEIELRIGYPATGGDITVYPGSGVIAGTVAYSGAQTFGNIVVAIFSDPAGEPLALETLPPGISTFSVSEIPAPAGYYVMAFRDVDNNGRPNGPEPAGYYGDPGPMSDIVDNAYLVSVASNSAVHLSSEVVIADMGQIGGRIDLGALQYNTRLVVQAGHGMPGSSFLVENQDDYSVQPCSWYGCVNEAYYNVGTLSPATDYAVIAFLDKNGDDLWNCPSADNCERFVSGPAGLSVTANGMTQADMVMPASSLPGAPQSFTGSVLSPTQILWGWADLPTETGYSLVDSNGDLLYPVSMNTTWYLETVPGGADSLSQVRAVRAANAAGDGPLSSTLALYTKAAPPALAVTGVGASSVTLSISGALNRLVIERSTASSGGYFVVYSSVPVGSRSDYGLMPNTSYYYRASCHNFQGLPGDYSSPASTLTLTASGSYIDGLVNYPGFMAGDLKVLFSTQASLAGAGVLALAGSATQQYYLGGLSQDTSYYLRAFVDRDGNGAAHSYEDKSQIVTAYLGASGLSGVDISVTASTIPPAAPSSLVATPGYQRVELQWAASPAANLLGYEALRSTNPAFTSAVSVVSGAGFSQALSFSDLTPPAGVPLYYRVRAVDWGRNRGPSASMSAPVTVSAGGSITGAVYAVDTSTGGIYHVRVSTTADPAVPSVADIMVSTFPNAYTVAGLPDGIYFVRAYRDFNGDFKQDRGREPSGTHGGIARPFDLYMTQGSSLSGIDVRVCNRIPMLPGAAQTAVILSTGCQALDRGASYYTKIYTFEVGYGAGKVPPGSQITAYADKTDPVIGITDPYLYLVGPSGDIAVRDDDSGGDSNSRIQYTVDSPGVYLLEPTSYGSGQTGSLIVGFSVTGGFAGRITGAISYSGAMSGASVVQIFESLDSGAWPVRMSSTTGSGFEFTGLRDGNFYLKAFKDVNANGVQDDFEPYGVYGGTYAARFTVNGGVTSSQLAISLAEPAIGSLSGTVFYNGGRSGELRIEAARQTGGDSSDLTVAGFVTMAQSTQTEMGQSYSLPLLAPSTSYVARAFVDENGNKRKDVMEPFASVTPVTVTAGTDTAGVNLSVATPGSGASGDSSFGGTITYEPISGQGYVSTGNVWVGWAADDNFDDILYAQTVSTYTQEGSTVSWTYYKSGIQSGATYYMAAFLDLNGNGQPDENGGEPVNMYTSGGEPAQIFVPASSSVVRNLALTSPATGYINGTAYYYGSLSGQAYVNAWNNACDDSGGSKRCSSSHSFAVTAGISEYPFSLRFLDPTTSYQMSGVIDLNGNQRTDPGEPSSYNPGYTVSGTTSAVLTLMDPGQMSGGSVGVIRGTVTYSGAQSGPKVARLFQGGFFGAPMRTMDITSNCGGNSCPYSFDGLPYGADYFVDAFIDAGSNGMYEPAFEAHGGVPYPISVSQTMTQSWGNSFALSDPGAIGGGVSTGSASMSGSVFVHSGAPTGTMRVQLFRYDGDISVMRVPVRSSTRAYTASAAVSTVSYSFSDLPNDGSRYLVRAFLDENYNFMPDGGEAWGQTRTIGRGITLSEAAEQKDLHVCVRASIEPGQTLNGALAVTDCVSADRGQASAYTDYYSFYGAAGDIVTVELIATGFSDTYLYLYGPEVSGVSAEYPLDLAAFDDDGAGNLNSRINSYALPSDGVYTIGAASYGGGITGAYTVSLRVSGGTNGSIAGTVRYNGTQGGNTGVGLFSSDPRTVQNAAPMVGVSLPAPGDFSFSELPSGTTYYIGAFIDVNGNGSPDQGEDAAIYPNLITLRPGQNLGGLLLEINPSTSAVFVGGAGQGTISGSVNYSGVSTVSTATALVIEMWNTATFRGTPVGIRVIQASGGWPVSYDLQVPGEQTYYLKAFLDSNGNRMPDMNEAKGAYEPNNEGPEPVFVGSAAFVTGRDFTLYDAGQIFSGGTQGAAGEGWASISPSSVAAGVQFTATVTVRLNGLGAGGAVVLGLPPNMYTPLQTGCDTCPGFVTAGTDGITYGTSKLQPLPPAPGSFSQSSNIRYIHAAPLPAGASVYFSIRNLYASCQGGMPGQQSAGMAFHVGTASSSLAAQPLVTGSPEISLRPGSPQNLSFRLADSAGYSMSVPSDEVTSMLAEARDNCWNLAPMASVYIATVSAYAYNQNTYGYDADPTVKFSTWAAGADSVTAGSARVLFEADRSTGVFYIKPTASGYRNIGLSYDLGWPNTFYMGVQVMAGGGISGANVSTGAYNNLSVSSLAVTITPNGDGNSDRAYINFALGDPNVGWHVLVSSRPFRTGLTASAVWETWGWGQPNPGQIFWEGRYNPWINFGGVAPSGAYFVRIEAGSLRNDGLRINLVVPQVSGQVSDAGTSPQRPLEGVMVNAFGSFGWGQTTTDSGGNYVLPGLNAGQYNFQFSKEEYGMVSSQAVVGVNGAVMNASMRRAPALTLIPSLQSGVTQQYDQWGWVNVRTPDWSRVYNGSLRVQSGTTTIDDGGRWDASTGQFVTRRRLRFDVESSTYTVEAELSGYGRVSTMVFVGAAGAEVTLPPFVRKANISGFVSLPAGAPNPSGAWISVNAMPVVLSSSALGGWGGLWLNQGLTSGTYNIFGLDPGQYIVRAQVPGYSGVSTGPITVSAGDINGLDMPEFGSGAVIYGTVTVSGNTSAFGMPSWQNDWSEPIKVNVNVWSPQTYTNGWTEVFVATDPASAFSTFTITGLDPGTTYQLFAHLDYSRDGDKAEFTVPGGFPKQVFVHAGSNRGDSAFSFEMASGTILGTLILPAANPAPDFTQVSLSGRITQSDNPYSVGETFGADDITTDLPGYIPYVSSAVFTVPGMETQSLELTFTYRLTGMSRTALVHVISGSTAAVVVDLRNQTYAIAGSIVNQVSNPLFNTMQAAIANSSFTLPAGYPVVSSITLPIEAVRRDLSEFGAAASRTVFDQAKTRVGFVTQAGTYTITGLQEGVYILRTHALKTCATCETSVAAQEKILTVRGSDHAAGRVILDGISIATSAVNLTLIDGWNISGTIALENSVQDARTLTLTLRNRRNEVVRSTAVALGNAGTNSLANSVAYSFTKLPGGEFYNLEVKDTKDSNGQIKYVAAPLRFPDMAASPNGMQSDLSGQNVTLKQGAMITLKLRDLNSASLLTQTNVALLAPSFNCSATANPWVQGGYYLAASSVSNRPIEADGTVRIGPVMPGVYYDVRCEQTSWDAGYMRQGAQNYAPAVSAGVRPSAGETRDLGVLDLKQGQAMTGFVRDRAGQPLVNIKVTAVPSYLENPLTVQAMSNREGRYSLWVSTFVSRYFDITAAPREQNQTVDVSTTVYMESVLRALDLTRSTTADFTLDVLPGGVSGSVATVDGGALSYPFGEMQGYPSAALFFQPYGTVPKNNPIGDIEAITEPGGSFSVPLSSGAYTLRVVSLGYSVPVVTFTVTGSGTTSLGALTLAKGGTVTGQIRKPDSTAAGGYAEPNSDEISLVAAANDGFTEFVMGTVVSDPVSRTITRYAISGFKPGIDYSLALVSGNGDLTFPSEGGVRFSQEESTATKSVNLTFRPSHGDCMVLSKYAGAGIRLKFVCSKALRNRTAEDNGLSLILATSSVDASGAALSAPDGSGYLSELELSADRKQFTALYSTGAAEGRFSVRLAAYTSEIDQSSGDNFRIDRVYDFYTGVKAVAASRVNNMNGGRLEFEGEETEDERGGVAFSPGTFALDGSTYALVGTTVTVEMFKADDLGGVTGVSALSSGSGVPARLESVRRGLPRGLYEAMQALREKRVGGYRTRAGASADVNPFSSFYDISLPAGISHVLRQPARITLSYDTALSSGTYASDLNVYYYNPNSQRYVLESAGRTVDTGNGTISVNVDHLSVFVVLAQAPVAGGTAYAYTGDELKAHNFPNPFNNTRWKSISLNDAIATGGYTAAAAPCVTQGTCVRVFIPAGTSGEMKLKVFNVAGELVRELELTGYTAGTTNVWAWDGRNGSGAEVASGVYIGEVKVGGDKAFFKMAVIKDPKYQ